MNKNIGASIMLAPINIDCKKRLRNISANILTDRGFTFMFILNKIIYLPQ